MLTVTVSDSNFGSNFSLNLATLRRWGVMGDAPNVSGIDDVVVQMAGFILATIPTKAFKSIFNSFA